MLTPADIRNPRKASGFDHVNINGVPGSGPHPAANYSYRAEGPAGSAAGTAFGRWRGPTRKDPAVAAQDYCDYANGNGITPSVPRYPSVSIDMGNTTRHAPKADPVKVIRPKHRGKHDLYDVLFVSAVGDVVCRKVGITARGHARYADVCKTLGLSIKPYRRAETFPSEDAARVAEANRVADLAASEHWKQVGKEAFIPCTSASRAVVQVAIKVGASA